MTEKRMHASKNVQNHQKRSQYSAKRLLWSQTVRGAARRSSYVCRLEVLRKHGNSRGLEVDGNLVSGNFDA